MQNVANGALPNARLAATLIQRKDPDFAIGECVRDFKLGTGGRVGHPLKDRSWPRTKRAKQKTPMSLAAASLTLYFDHDELFALAEDLSGSVRSDPHLAPVMHQIVGNHWRALEQGVFDLLLASLSGEMVPGLAADRLNKVLVLLSRKDCQRLHALFLEAVFARFPLLDAANFVGVADAILSWALPLLEETDLRQRQRKLLKGLSAWQRSTF